MKKKFICIKYFCFYDLGTYGGQLLSTHQQQNLIQWPCCYGKQIISCKQVELNKYVIGVQELEIKQLGLIMNLTGTSKNHYYYSGGGSFLALYFDPKTDVLYSQIFTKENKLFQIEQCVVRHVHVLKEIDLSDDFLMSKDAAETNTKADAAEFNDTADALNREDTTIAHFSIKFYYTPEFEASFSKIEEIDVYIFDLVDKLNVAFINSNVFMRASIYCIEKATIDETGGMDVIFYRFLFMKPSPQIIPSLYHIESFANVRGSADAAYLLVYNTTTDCGVAPGYSGIESGQTLAMGTKGCGHATFAHEIGHTIGLNHNREQIKKQNPGMAHSGDGYGHLIGTEYYTIMSYPQSQHAKFINYFSNPDVIHPESQQPTGEVGKANSARFINERRFRYSNVGDESLNCWRYP